MNKKSKNIFGFTLVELIVVITIVGILSTIGFVSYSGYLTGARDSNRYSQMTKLSDSLQTYAASKSLPLPDDSIDITASGSTNVIAYQGYVGVDVLETIDYTNGGKDPKDDSYFTYYLTKDRKKMQLLAFMEDSISSLFPINSVSYALDYSERAPKAYGNKLGVLLSTQENSLNTPIQDVVTTDFIDIFDSPDPITAYFSNEDENISYSGYALGAYLSTRLGGPRPGDCPEGFIGIRGNLEYSKDGFCVAQYEMSYSDADTPNSTNARNTVWYEENKTPVSMPGKYPISMISANQAREACESMGRGFHLITNHEWMTIARNIETNPINWSSGEIGNGYLYNGITSTATLGCDAGATGGNVEPRPTVARTGPGLLEECNLKRAFSLDNGKKIWDLSGNLFELVDKSDDYESFFSLPTATSDGGGNWDPDGIYDLSDMRKIGSLFGYGVTVGMGSVNFPQGVQGNTFMRGGFALQGERSGLYTLFLGNTEAHASDVTGFRCTRSF